METLLVLLLTHKNVDVLDVIGNLLRVLTLNSLKSVLGLVFAVFIVIKVHFVHLRRLNLCVMAFIGPNIRNMPLITTHAHTVIVIKLYILPRNDIAPIFPLRFID